MQTTLSGGIPPTGGGRLHHPLIEHKSLDKKHSHPHTLLIHIPEGHSPTGKYEYPEDNLSRHLDSFRSYNSSTLSQSLTSSSVLRAKSSLRTSSTACRTDSESDKEFWDNEGEEYSAKSHLQQTKLTQYAGHSDHTDGHVDAERSKPIHQNKSAEHTEYRGDIKRNQEIPCGIVAETTPSASSKKLSLFSVSSSASASSSIVTSSASQCSGLSLATPALPTVLSLSSSSSTRSSSTSSVFNPSSSFTPVLELELSSSQPSPSPPSSALSSKLKSLQISNRTIYEDLHPVLISAHHDSHTHVSTEDDSQTKEECRNCVYTSGNNNAHSKGHPSENEFLLLKSTKSKDHSSNTLKQSVCDKTSPPQIPSSSTEASIAPCCMYTEAAPTTTPDPPTITITTSSTNTNTGPLKKDTPFPPLEESLKVVHRNVEAFGGSPTQSIPSLPPKSAASAETPAPCSSHATPTIGRVRRESPINAFAKLGYSFVQKIVGSRRSTSESCTSTNDSDVQVKYVNVSEQLIPEGDIKTCNFTPGSADNNDNNGNDEKGMVRHHRISGLKQFFRILTGSSESIPSKKTSGD